jgi:hypothetical protein
MERKLTPRSYFLLLFLVFLFSFHAFGCISKEDPSHTAIKEWVKKEYGLSAKVELSGELQISMPEIQTFRGGIIIDKERKEGIFFYNQETKSVYFTQGLGIPENKGD